MARIRTVKPEFWEDEAMSLIPMQARLLFIGTWNFADDQGVISSSIKYLKAKIFPYDDSLREHQVKTWVDLLVNARMLIPFDFDLKSYYYIRTFKKHQLIDKRYTKFIVPEKIVAEKLAGIDLEQITTLPHSEHKVITRSKGSVKEGEEDVYKDNEIVRSFKHLKITFEENKKILELGYSQKQINQIYDNIENYKKNSNYTSLYLTAINWLKKDFPNVVANSCPYTDVQLREVRATRAAGFKDPQWFDKKYEEFV